MTEHERPFQMYDFQPWIEEFNQRFLLIIAYGIKSDNYRDKSKWAVEDIPVMVLKLDHLEIGFAVLSVPLILSVAVFIIEISIPKIKSFFRGFSVFIVIRIFYKLRETNLRRARGCITCTDL